MTSISWRERSTVTCRADDHRTCVSVETSTPKMASIKVENMAVASTTSTIVRPRSVLRDEAAQRDRRICPLPFRILQGPPRAEHHRDLDPPQVGRHVLDADQPRLRAATARDQREQPDLALD